MGKSVAANELKGVFWGKPMNTALYVTVWCKQMNIRYINYLFIKLF